MIKNKEKKRKLGRSAKALIISAIVLAVLIAVLITMCALYDVGLIGEAVFTAVVAISTLGMLTTVVVLGYGIWDVIQYGVEGDDE